ncbi:hypothetical protein [Thiocystis violascens]|uniref:Uncharacterized protein n=1 Tax=Thiocystis violascens (strain ATCC 17096 / DSM 198 / 6111) TaxID=765911 RepID=I3Y806_THIV6|nr:hypothetical protein [Thiocystis violascens]AFL73124.1 hypothetical protein Thivi_1093 [Thiocystis violascens DSM 198]
MPLPEAPRVLSGGDRSASGADVSGEAGVVSNLYSPDPLRLRKQVADACGDPRAVGDRHFLRSLVADLYFSGVDPATGTEALLLGNCGTLTDILTEMVTRGGPDSLDPIVARARSIHGSGAARKIQSAAKAGLARHASMTESDPRPEEILAYGMLYFPSTGDFSRLDSAMALNRLYEDAIPGYGIYTFVLLGRGFANASESDAARYRELFRVIETYVTTSDENNSGPTPETPAFLVPISAENLGRPLIEQVAVDLSNHMRRHLGQSLRQEGHAPLAATLDTGAGPFLISTLEPRFTPTGQDAPRLVADLSMIGAEYIYGIVDAYDRPIPPEASGRVESLLLIRDRLLGLPMKPAVMSEFKTKIQNAWVFMIGRFAEAHTGDLRAPSLT